MNQLKFTILLLAFIKCMFFVRIFEQFGFLVQMVILTLIDLVPFFAFLVFAIFFYALFLYVLIQDVDEEIQEVKGPGFGRFGLLLL